MHGVNRATQQRHWVAAIAAAALAVATVGASVGSAAASDGHHHGKGHHDDAFVQVNLVSDVPGLAPALDPDVKNPWGITFGPTTPLWVANQFSNKITVYRGANGVDPFSRVTAINVDASSPTGAVFNPTTAFAVTQQGATGPAPFLFNENAFGPGPEDLTGEISGWLNTTPLPTTTSVVAQQPGAFYAGLALVPWSKRGPVLLAAGNAIDIYDSEFNLVDAPKAFVDPYVDPSLLPYNVMFLKGKVYVTYADAQGGDGGALAVFSRNGRFIRHLADSADGDPLNGPWGMAIAPKHWGDFGGDLLVGNVNDGMINAFDRHNGKFRGTLEDANGQPLVNLGLWGLAFGNGVIGTPDTLLFAAGIGAEVEGGPVEEVYEHGLIGLIKPVDDDHDHGGHGGPGHH